MNKYVDSCVKTVIDVLIVYIDAIGSRYRKDKDNEYLKQVLVTLITCKRELRKISFRYSEIYF